jgi:hypothetical protein
MNHRITTAAFLYLLMAGQAPAQTVGPPWPAEVSVPAYPHVPFADISCAQRWVARFVGWNNGEHRHSAIRYVTPDERHAGREHQILTHRHEIYQRARNANPERWSCGTRNWAPVGQVVLNPERVQISAIAQ